MRQAAFSSCFRLTSHVTRDRPLTRGLNSLLVALDDGFLATLIHCATVRFFLFARRARSGDSRNRADRSTIEISTPTRVCSLTSRRRRNRRRFIVFVKPIPGSIAKRSSSRVHMQLRKRISRPDQGIPTSIYLPSL